MASERKFHYAFIVLIVVSLIRGFAGPGINASSGLFLTPVARDLGVGIGRLSLYLSISSVTTLFWLPVAGNLLNKTTVKKAAILCIFLQTFAFIACGTARSVWWFYVLAVPLAMGAVVLVNLMGPILINRWFASNIGLVMGIMMTITSLAGAVFQPFLTTMITQRGWRFSYVAFGILAFVVMLILVLFFLKDRPEGNKQPFSFSSKKEATAPRPPQNNVSAAIAIRLPSFYLLLLYMIVLTGFAAFSQHITTYALDSGYALSSIGSALSMSMIGSAIGSILIGFCSDRAGIVPTSVAVMMTALLTIALYLFKGDVYWVFFIATFLHGFATSSIGVVAPLLVMAFFGPKNYEKIFSFVMMGSPFASIILMPAYGFIYDSFQSYHLVFYFLLAALIIGIFSVQLGYKNTISLSNTKKE